MNTWIKPDIMTYDTDELMKQISAKSWSGPGFVCSWSQEAESGTCVSAVDGSGGSGPSDPGFEEIICLFALSWCGAVGVRFECKATAACKTDEPY